jgi:acid phosphatase family membrane protein YuiD
MFYLIIILTLLYYNYPKKQIALKKICYNRIMDNLNAYNVFIIPIIVGVVVQVTKFILYGFKHGWDIRYLMTHGHMPSAHTAFMVALVTSVGYYEGLDSGAFALAIALGIIVIDDAVRLRMILGDQGRYLNMLVQQLNISEKQYPRLKERVGHRLSEVIVGGIYGLILTIFLIVILG